MQIAMRTANGELEREHRQGCPRLQFWDAGEYEASCTCDYPRSRSTDPETSHQAEAYMRSTGRLKAQQQLVLGLIRNNPGWTSRELDENFVLDGMAHRRCCELERAKLIRRGEPRKSHGYRVRAATWWPVEGKP